MKRTLLLLATVALTLGRLWAEEGQGKSVTLDIVYLKSLDDLPMVAVTVNGQDGTFLIDTGQVAEGTTLTPAFARKCGITTQESTATLAVGKGKEAIELKDLGVLVLNRGVERDGILGYTFFEKVRTTMDYPGNKVTFSTYDFEQKPPEGAVRAPMEFLVHPEFAYLWRGSWFGNTKYTAERAESADKRNPRGPSGSAIFAVSAVKRGPWLLHTNAEAGFCGTNSFWPRNLLKTIHDSGYALTG